LLLEINICHGSAPLWEISFETTWEKILESKFSVICWP